MDIILQTSGLISSYFIFYFSYKKLGIEKLMNRPSYRIAMLIFSAIFYFIALSIVDYYSTTKIYHALFVGLFIGPTVSLIPFIKNAQKINKK